MLSTQNKTRRENHLVTVSFLPIIEVIISYPSFFMSFTLSEQLVQAIATYLSTKPFNEVAQMIQVLNNELQPQVTKTATPEPTDIPK